MPKDDDLLPKKKPVSTRGAKTDAGVSPPMRRLMRIVRGLGIVLGGFVTLVGLMSVVGVATDNFWIRLLVALLVVVGLPAFLSDRLLKRTSMRGGLGLVGDIFAIVLLGIALVLVAVPMVSTPLFVREGDRYARSGSRTMARMAYFFGGVSPAFPGDAAPAASGSAAPRASGPDGGAR